MLLLFCLLLMPETKMTLASETNHIKIVLNPQGGIGGVAEIYVEPGGALPEITIPSRRGYDFLGYYTQVSGAGTKYYDSQGKAVRNCDFSDTSGLYACWQVKKLTIEYRNMENAVSGEKAPTTHVYGKNTEVSNPTKEGYVFFGWQVNGSAIASQNLTLGANAYNDNITLTAVWNKAALVTVTNIASTTVVMHDDDLRDIFQNQVADGAKGVTADDLNSEEVRLIMTARDADDKAEGVTDIFELAQGEILKLYDFTVEKEVTKSGEDPVRSHLTELPTTVEVNITLSADLQGQSSYRVYRFHEGEAQAIPTGPVTDATKTREYYTISSDRTSITIHTRRLSTYAVVGSGKSLGGVGTLEKGSQDIDVQAQVLEGGDSAVYSVDIVWGDMRFTYSTGREWDPVDHRYTDVRIYDWIPETCYDGVNNKIAVYNHSNADISVGFMATPIFKEGVEEKVMDGVDMVINEENKSDAPEAKELYLSRVPRELASAPCVNGYLWLNGSPTDPAFYDGLVTDDQGYVKVAQIAVTITHLDGARTPKASG